MAKDIGIDLGTTFSALAVAGRVALSPDYPADGIYLEACDVTIIPTPYGEPTFASVIAADPDNPGSYVFAADAVAVAEDGGAPIMFAKRGMGTQQTFTSGERELSAPDVAALFLGYLRECAEQALGEPVGRAVVTHPAYFDRAAVEATRSAAQAAGFDMSTAEQMLMEPVAAALAYTYGDDRDPLQVLAYDLGGGTFDVSFLERRDGVVAMRAFDGNNLLGGYNFDRALVQWMVEAMRARGREITLDVDGDPSQVARLLQLAERVKLDLADASSDTQPVRVRGRGVLRDDNGREVPIDETITRAEFVALITDYLEQTIEQCRATLAQTDTEWNEIDLVLLVGGSTRGPWVEAALQAAFPNARCRLFEPDLCVAAGAALYGLRTLPQAAAGGACRLALDVARQSTMDEIDIGGDVSGVDGCQVTLIDANGAHSSAPVEDGSFLFADQLLAAEGPNAFVLLVTDDAGAQLLRHEFEIVYAPDGEETTVMSVLPRALAVETVNGLVPIAQAGAELPARCEETFERQNSNPSLTLRLFQDHAAIGEVRIDDIPPQGGIGAKVTICLDIRPSGELVGEASIYAPEGGALVLQAPVEIRIEALELPDREQLRATYESLKAQWRAMDAADAATEVTQQCARIDQLLTEALQDVQEIAAAVDTLALLIAPPADDLDPPHASFMALCAGVRKAIEALRSEASEEATPAQDTDELSVRRAQRRQQSLQQLAARLEASLEELANAGEQAYLNRDRRTWGSTNTAIRVLLAQAGERDKQEAIPAAGLTRIHGSMYINELITRLNTAADRLRNDNRLADWQTEIRRIFNGLHAALNRVNEIKDTTSDEQALAIRRQAEQSIAPLVAAINNIGVDIARIGEGTVTQTDTVETTAEEDSVVAASLLSAGHGSLAEVLAGDENIVDQVDENGNTPLMLAAHAGDASLVTLLIERGASLEARSRLGRTPLMFCSNQAVANCLLEAGADIAAVDNDGVDALMVAAHEGHESVLDCLIDRGADLERRWAAGQTPLLVAARAGQLACVDRLLRAGADSNAVCGNERNALHHAAEAGAGTVIRRLLDVAPPIDQVDVAHVTPVFLASQAGHAEIVTMLVAHNADVSIRRREDSATPLMVACWEGHRQVVETLLPRSGDLNARDHDGDTALINAAHKGHTDLVTLLAEAGADVNASNNRGQTALMIAARAGSSDTVACLLKLGADRDVSDPDGNGVLEYAQAGPEDERERVLQALS